MTLRTSEKQRVTIVSTKHALNGGIRHTQLITYSNEENDKRNMVPCSSIKTEEGIKQTRQNDNRQKKRTYQKHYHMANVHF